MYIAEQQKWLDRQVLHGKMGTVLGAFYRYRHISSKTSSFGGTSAQPLGVALFFVHFPSFFNFPADFLLDPVAERLGSAGACGYSCVCFQKGICIAENLQFRRTSRA